MYRTTTPSGIPTALDIPAPRQMLFALAILALIYLVPPATFFALGTTSHSTGLFLGCVIVIATITPRTAIGDAIAPLIILALALVAHLAIASFFQPPHIARALLSLALLGVFLIAALSVGFWFFKLRDETIERSLSIMRFVMLGIAAAGILRIQPPLGEWDNGVFPFTEPSHFALVFTPLVIHACATRRGWRRYAWLGAGYAIAVLLQNLTMVLGLTIAALVCLPLYGILGAGGLLALAIGRIDITYFVERLDFSSQTRNLSSLVYLQGWELASDSFARSHGWGIGFQQLGLGVINSPTADLIFMLIRRDLNLADGGFIFAKLVAEFGVFGLLFALAFVVFALRMVLKLRGVALGRYHLSHGQAFAMAIVCGYSVDMFARGVGYFSGTSFMFVAAVFFLLYRRTPRPADGADISASDTDRAARPATGSVH